MHIKYNKAALLALICSLIPLSLLAEDIDNEHDFFSYKRFYLNAAISEKVSQDREVRGDIKSFMQNFSDGIYAIDTGDLKTAKTKLLKARAVWPEYFGTDFLLARVCEDLGNYTLSANFYKSYLNKLKDLSDGRYRISERLIRGLTPYGVEDYNVAYRQVKDRLHDRGIDLNAVQPYYAIPGFLRFLIIVVMLAPVYAIVAYRVVPYIKRGRLINNPPAGFWICKKCAANNSNLRKECEKCGQKNDL